MKATEKELQCIDISRKFREKIINRRTIEAIGNNTPQNEIGEIYKLNNEVSEIKLFSQLWNDKGLRDYGVIYLKYSGYTLEEQQDCIIEWFKILFGDIRKLEVIARQIRERLNTEFVQFKKENPNGYISLVPREHLLPIEIDKVFGEYLP